MALKWTESLSTGVDELDKQHKELFERFNAFLAAMAPDKRQKEMDETLTFLEEYVLEHFGNEESYMEHYDYPKSESHKSLHAEFKGKLKEIREKFNSEGTGLGLMVETNRFLSNWLVNHICLVDKELGDFLSDKLDQKDSSKT